MKILALAPRMPSTPDAGVRIRCHHLLSRLAENHEISLLAVDDRAAGPRSSAQLAQFCARHAVFQISPIARAVRGSLTLLRGEAIRVGWFHNPDLQRTMEQWLSEYEFDLLLVFCCSMAPYWLRSPRARALPVLMDHVDAESAKCEQYARYGSLAHRWLFSLERRRLVALEQWIEAQARASIVVSESEAAALKAVVPGSGVVALPNGVDGDRFARPQLTRRDDPPSVLFVGRMDDGANEDAVLYFARDILPLLQSQRPELRFDVVGARPPASVKALRRMEGVRVTGWVEDVRPYLWQASLAVAPMRIAHGMQNKVLEAMAASLPVVATPVAARGIRGEGREWLRVEEDPGRFAQAVLDLLDDGAAAKIQAHAALDAVRERHSWDRSAQMLEEMLEQVVSR